MANGQEAERNLPVGTKKIVYEKKLGSVIVKYEKVHKGNGRWERTVGSYRVVTDSEEIRKFFGENGIVLKS